MTITWDSLEDLRAFILHADISWFCGADNDWGTAGLIITSPSSPRLSPDEIKEHGESFTIGSRGDKLICTPCVHELVWYMKQLLQLMNNKHVSFSAVFEGTWAAATGFFLTHKGEYDAKELLLYINSFQISMRDDQMTARQKDVE